MLWALGRMMGGVVLQDSTWNPRDGGGAAAVFLVVPVFTFFLLPITSMYSRRHEFEADAYAA